jgi:hypothetical protein
MFGVQVPTPHPIENPMTFPRASMTIFQKFPNMEFRNKGYIYPTETPFNLLRKIAAVHVFLSTIWKISKN